MGSHPFGWLFLILVTGISPEQNPGTGDRQRPSWHIYCFILHGYRGDNHSLSDRPLFPKDRPEKPEKGSPALEMFMLTILHRVM